MAQLSGRRTTKPKEEPVKVQSKLIRPCVHRGDPEDDFCKSCDGLTIHEGNKSYDADKHCDGYEADTADVDLPFETEENTPKTSPEPLAEETVVDTAVVAEIRETSHVDDTSFTTLIRAESGVSVETKTGWYRFTYTEERMLTHGADVAKERAALWATVHDEVDKQAEEVLNG